MELENGKLVGVSTHLKNISQIGNLPQIGVKINKYLKPPPSKVWQSIVKETRFAITQSPLGRKNNHYIMTGQPTPPLLTYTPSETRV